VMAEAPPAPVEEEKVCDNCLIYGWKQPEDKSVIRRCGRCKFVSYCSEECQREHWRKVHKDHCKYLAKKEVLPNSSHDVATCKVCKEESKAGKVGLVDINNPVLPCTMTINTSRHYQYSPPGRDMALVSVRLALGCPALPLAEMTGSYHSRVEATLAIMMRIMLKMKVTKHSMWIMDEASCEDLFQLLGKTRHGIWCAFTRFPSSSIALDSMTLLGSGDRVLMFELMNKINDMMEAVGYDDQSVFRPWDTLRILAFFLLHADINAKFIADCLGVPGLSDRMQKTRTTHVQFSQMWGNVLGMLGEGLVPYTSIVEGLCAGNLVQQCMFCGDMVCVQNAAVYENMFCTNTTMVYPVLVINFALTYVVCDKKSCEESQRDPTLLLEVFRMSELYPRLDYEYGREVCDYCFWFNKEVRGHRCAGCKTKVYCGMECLLKDEVHLKECKKMRRKRKKGNDVRREKGKQELDDFEEKMSRCSLLPL